MTFVKVTSTSTVTEIQENVMQCMKKVLSESSTSCKDQYLQKFEKIFQNALYRHLLFQGRPLQEIVEKGYDPAYLEHQIYFLETLMPQLDDQLVKTTKKRKLYPQKCTEYLKKRLKLEREAIKSQEVNLATTNFSPQSSPTPDKDKILTLCSESMKNLSNACEKNDANSNKIQSLKIAAEVINNILPQNNVREKTILASSCFTEIVPEIF